MLRLGPSPQQWRLSFTVSTMTTKSLDAKHRTSNAEAEVAMGHFHREFAFSSVRDCVMFLDTAQQQLKESSGTKLLWHGVFKTDLANPRKQMSSEE